MATRPLVGTSFAGYRVERVLGRGGMSVVYLAEHPRLKNKVALKLVAPALAEDDVFRERLLREDGPPPPARRGRRLPRAASPRVAARRLAQPSERHPRVRHGRRGRHPLRLDALR